MQQQSDSQPDVPRRRPLRTSTRMRPRLPQDGGVAPTPLPVTARQAATVRESLMERHDHARAAVARGIPNAEFLAAQTEEALRGVEPYVDHGGGLADGLVELLGQLGITIVPLRDATGTDDGRLTAIA